MNAPGIVYTGAIREQCICGRFYRLKGKTEKKNVAERDEEKTFRTG
jgi:hypothetical protein